MEIPAKYTPGDVEHKWYSYWLEHKFFNSKPDDREPFTIVIPPPNVTGVLHMGHMLNNTIQDVLTRRARMKGMNACWVPGTDHASIATEAKVVNKLKEQGIDKHSLTREEFLKHAWEWTEKHGGIILNQLQKLGASCDWDRTCFTMDDERSKSVIQVFVDLYNKGLVYRGVRMVNWDPAAKTAVSDEEVIYKEEQSKLYYIRYKVDGSQDEWVTIATTRPETILGDTAVCVNPQDPRFHHLKGKSVIVPLINRVVPIIQDEYVDMEFGTGCLKITPAHDENDYKIGMEHNLEVIDIFNDNGTLNEKAKLYVGKDRFAVRTEIVADMQTAGNIVKIEDYTNKVGYSERTHVVIEPKLSAQWFLKMKEITAPALENVMNDEIEFFPKKFKNVYRHWMENIKDWCISRQLWWGHQIPVFYLPDGSHVCAATVEEALLLAQQKSGNAALTIADLRQDEDVLDTWASSWLWPISVFGGITNPNNEEINYYYPTNVLVTGHDIIFFWVARMIMTGYEYRKTYPFKHVYFTGMVRDKLRRKMSKSLGNSPEPLELIQKYGADGVRVGMLLCSPAGGDLLYDDALPEQGRNFSSKIWNAFRLVQGWNVDNSIEQPAYTKAAIEALSEKIKEASMLLDEQFAQYRISEAMMTVYKLFWDELSAWFLEIVKPEYGKPIDGATYNATLELFESVLQLLHPFMPFITEEVWNYLKPRNNGESIMISQIPSYSSCNSDLLVRYERIKEVVAGIRGIRKDKQVPFKETIELYIKGIDSPQDFEFVILAKLGNISAIHITNEDIANAASFRVDAIEYFIPLAQSINVEEEKQKIQEELTYIQGFLASVDKKLMNEKFVSSAPASVVDGERKKKADALEKIELLEKRLKSL
ncbi:MAG: Valine--tRNA ligase [Bacteroidetes bacterium ADurb.Bin217]|nr:MAG: Valine--tRNA ligase [Bacteroidetes bacterium ADurb.Bin217]